MKNMNENNGVFNKILKLKSVAKKFINFSKFPQIIGINKLIQNLQFIIQSVESPLFLQFEATFQIYLINLFMDSVRSTR